MNTGMNWRRVKRGAACLLAAALLLTSASLPLGLAGTAAAQEEDTKTAETDTPAPYAALQTCNVGMELKAGEGCHVSGSGTSFVVGRGSGCIVLYEPSLLAVCHATATDSSSVLSASKGDDGSWTIEELSDAPGACGELTGLHEAVRLGNAEWVACLAATGANVNARDEGGDTPLHIAVEKGSVELTQILIAAGADISLQSNAESPVPIGLQELNRVFASAGSEASLAGAEIVAKVERGVTPLQLAVEGGDLELVQILVVAGMATPEPAAVTDADSEAEPTVTPTPAEVNPALSQPGWMDSTLLHDAIEEEDEELVRMLVEAGADVDMSGWMDETPLHAAIEIGHVEIVRILVEAGADVNKPGWMGQTPLALAVEEGNAQILEILLGAATAKDIEPVEPTSVEDAAGRTPLIIAVESQDIELVQTLIASGADLNTPDAAGNTPLHIAVDKGNSELVRILVEAGADILAENAAGKTVLTMAAERGDLEITQLLLSSQPKNE